MRYNLFWANADVAADLWHDNKDINYLGNDNVRPLLGTLMLQVLLEYFV